MEAMSGGSPGAVALPLQFRSTSPCLDIRTESQNTSLPGRADPKGAALQRNLLIEGAFSGVEECPLHALQFGPSGQLSHSGSAPGSLATIDDGSTMLCPDLHGEEVTSHNLLPVAAQKLLPRCLPASLRGWVDAMSVSEYRQSCCVPAGIRDWQGLPECVDNPSFDFPLPLE